MSFEPSPLGSGISGDIASGVADSGNPVKIGGVASSSVPAAVAAGQRENLWLGLNGQIIIGGSQGTVNDLANNYQLLLSAGGVTSPLAVGLMLWDGVEGVRQRVPNIFKTATTAAAGSLAVWAPQAGKKFRLMGYMIEVTANASLAAGGINTFSWLDAAAAINLIHSDFEPTTAVTTGEVGYTTGWIMLGNGYLSSAANNVLNLSVLTALVTGALRVNVIGTEE